MKSRNHRAENEKPHWSRDEYRTAFLFWLLWSLYVLLAAVGVVALLTNWPHFLHEQAYLK